MSLPPSSVFRAQSQITFLYYDDLDSPAAFYGDILGLELVINQDMARIYRAAGQAFIGIVDAAKGYHPARKENSVVISLTVEDVNAWYETLAAVGIKILTEPKIHERAPVRSFFLEDPGGYTLEIQEFTRPEDKALLA